MRLTVHSTGTAPKKCDALVAFGFEGAKHGAALPSGAKVPAAAAADFDGSFRAVRLSDAKSGPAERVLLVGLGPGAALDAEKLRRAAALAVRTAEKAKLGRIAMWVDPAVSAALGDARAAGIAVAEGALLGAYSYEELKSAPATASLKTVAVHGDGAAFAAGAKRGQRSAAANAYARDLQNAPGNKMRPRDMAARARKLATASPRVTCRVHDEKAMKTMGMGSLLSVSRGSSEPAYLLHLTYKPKGKAKGKVALVGKGLTFDAGGISLKPSAAMDEMKFDMSGGAAVLGVFHALANGLDVPHEVHGVVACSENLPDASATKPGDVVTAMNGVTIEVLNTDAEGRLILADALVYTDRKIKPDTVIDLATLTGAVVIALGHELSGMFPTTDSLRDQLTASGERVGELVWPLPLLDCHREQMKSRVADLRNINTKGTGNGSTTGAAFLASFVGDREWCHLDIAGTAWGGIDRDYVGGPAGSGVGVRLLLDYLEYRK